MPYQLVLDNQDHRDLASGHVLRSAPGYPAFPVRLAEEMFLRSAAHLPQRRLALWDPCCGSGYLATVLGLRQRDRLRAVLCTDVDAEAVELVRRNLALLSMAGLAQRRDELRRLFDEHHKAGHAEAAEASIRLADQLRAGGGDLPARAIRVDVFDPGRLGLAVADDAPDLVVTDMPYGDQARWGGSLPTDVEPLVGLARGLCAVLGDETVIALCGRARKISLAGARALERLRLGNRAVFIGRVGQIRQAVS